MSSCDNRALATVVLLHNFFTRLAAHPDALDSLRHPARWLRILPQAEDLIHWEALKT